jgi:hypothetical protein
MPFGFDIGFNPYALGQINAADKQLQLNNQVGANQNTMAQSMFSMAAPAIGNQINPNAATRNALTQLPTLAANAPFNAATQQATNRMARTNNSAGFGSTLDKLAMDKGKADSTAALQGQQAVQNLQNEGIKNASGFFGAADDTMAKIYANAPGILDARAKMGSPFSGSFGYNPPKAA